MSRSCHRWAGLIVLGILLVGVPLLAIVQAAEPVTDPKHRNFAMRLAVVVRAADGYAVTFGMGDLMPDVGNHPAWIESTKEHEDTRRKTRGKNGSPRDTGF
jgi:hypothetical protein